MTSAKLRLPSLAEPNTRDPTIRGNQLVRLAFDHTEIVGSPGSRPAWRCSSAVSPRSPDGAILRRFSASETGCRRHRRPGPSTHPQASISRTRWPLPRPPMAGLHDIAPTVAKRWVTRAVLAPIRAAALAALRSRMAAADDDDVEAVCCRNHARQVLSWSWKTRKQEVWGDLCFT